MKDFVFYNEEWNNHMNNEKKDSICPIHQVLLDIDGFCYKCLEEKNSKYVTTDSRKIQRIFNHRKERIGKY